jgi:3-deoxy-D-manno-octulosonic-acid transferase
MVFRLYNLGLILLAVVVLPFYLLRSIRSGARREGMPERFGNYSAELVNELQGVPFIWVHAVSVGETRAVVPLLKALRKKYPDYRILVSNVTETGHKIAVDSLWIDHAIYFPFDFSWTVKKVFSQLRPALVIIVETELWPNFIRQTSAAEIPLMLVNGRLSDRSYPRYRKFRFFFKPLLQRFSVLCMQSQTDSARIVSLGASRRKVENTGNLKYDYELKDIAGEEILRRKAGYRLPHRTNVLVAGSTHEGEEMQVWDVYRRLLNESALDLSLILIPRHPQRCGDLRQKLQDLGSPCRLRSQLAGSDTKLQPGEVLIIDTLGEVVDCYSIADLVFVGGSLVNIGGHNLLEAALVGKPVLFGPHVQNFKMISSKLIRAGGGIRVADKEELFRQCRLLLNDPARARIMGQAGQALILENSGATERIMRHISRILR